MEMEMMLMSVLDVGPCGSVVWLNGRLQ